MEARPDAEAAWTEHVNEQVGQMLIAQTDSWFMGSNIPGKKRAFLAYFGGAPSYRQRCEESAAKGYEGFEVS
jgi:cyclohexanone monooxygenase